MFSEKRKKIKIAFQVKAHAGWTAGNVYLETLFQALKETTADELSIGVLGRNGDIPENSSFLKLADEIIRFEPIERWTRSWVVHNLGSRLFQRNLLDDHFLKQHRVDVVAFGEAPEGSRIPSMGWIPDFQHLNFPEFFSTEEQEHRNHVFSRLIEKSTRVILISESAKGDFETFAPDFAGKARVLTPITSIPPAVFETDARATCDSYNLPEKFFYLPNQFWKHKNHLTAFQAVRILKQKGIPVTLVCSGNSGDYRNATFFSELLLEISRLDIRDQVALLGLVPRDHVFQLIRRSICVLNPSLFEGYGMTVDETRSLSKPMILSDIPAHREQQSSGIFFEPLNSEELAEKMEHIWNEGTPGPNFEGEAEYRRELPERKRKYAGSFMSIVREVVD